MRAPPPISKLPSYPVTGGISLLAIGVSLAWWAKRIPIDSIDMSNLAWSTQPWRLWTSALPHVGIMHLAFDVYWFWVFGTLVEAAFGPLAMLAIFLLLQAGAGAATYRYAEGSCWYDLGIAYERLGRYPEASDAFHHALELEPNSAEFQAALKTARSSGG